MEFWLYPTKLLAGTGQQAHHCHYSGENSERVTHVSNYFSSLRAVFSSGPQKRVPSVSWEMVTSSAQILHKEFSSSLCSFVLAPMQTPPAPYVTAKWSAGVYRQDKIKPPLLPIRTNQLIPKARLCTEIILQSVC